METLWHRLLTLDPNSLMDNKNRFRFQFLFIAFCGVFLLAPGTQAVTGGTAVADHCDFPGIAVVHNLMGGLICTGIIANNSLIMPLGCVSMVTTAVKYMSIQVNNGTYTWVYEKSDMPYPGFVKRDGTFSMPLEDSNRLVVSSSVNCPNPPIYYDGVSPLNTSSCQLAAYGAEINDGAKYDPGKLKAINITKSTSAPCCSMIVDTMTEAQLGADYMSYYPYNCVKATYGSPCGLGDLGGPVACDTVAGERVLIGLAATAPCDNNTYFLIHDVTQSSTRTKFGIPAISAS